MAGAEAVVTDTDALAPVVDATGEPLVFEDELQAANPIVASRAQLVRARARRVVPTSPPVIVPEPGIAGRRRWPVGDIISDLEGAGQGVATIIAGSLDTYEKAEMPVRARPMTRWWIWAVPSGIVSILASRK